MQLENNYPRLIQYSEEFRKEFEDSFCESIDDGIDEDEDDYDDDDGQEADDSSDDDLENLCPKYLIFSTGSKTYTPHQIGFKRVKNLNFPKKLDPGPSLKERIAAKERERRLQVNGWLWLCGSTIQCLFLFVAE